MAFRAFIAVDLEAPPGVSAFADALRATGAPLKLVDLDILHLTLKFLGDTPEAAVPALDAGIREAVAGVAPFEVRMRGAGAFPSPRRIQVVWVGVEDGGRLAGVAARIDEALEKRDFPREARAFHAHATVARVKGGANREALARVIEAHEGEDFGAQRVGSVRLKKSVLSARGPSYSDVVVAPLGS